jgi:hypothetical protein
MTLFQTYMKEYADQAILASEVVSDSKPRVKSDAAPHIEILRTMCQLWQDIYLYELRKAGL